MTNPSGKVKVVRATQFEENKVYVRLDTNTSDLYARHKNPEHFHVFVISRNKWDKITVSRISVKNLEDNGAMFAELLSSNAFGTMPKGQAILVKPRNNMKWEIKHFNDFDYDNKDILRVSVIDADRNTPQKGYRYAVAVTLEK